MGKEDVRRKKAAQAQKAFVNRLGLTANITNLCMEGPRHSNNSKGASRSVQTPIQKLVYSPDSNTAELATDMSDVRPSQFSQTRILPKYAQGKPGNQRQKPVNHEKETRMVERANGHATESAQYNRVSQFMPGKSTITRLLGKKGI